MTKKKEKEGRPAGRPYIIFPFPFFAHLRKNKASSALDSDPEATATTVSTSLFSGAWKPQPFNRRKTRAATRIKNKNELLFGQFF
jgi:hypothetical protein